MCSFAGANTRSVDFAGRRAERLEEKKLERRLWSQTKRYSLQDKSFPITEWDKHYSTFGSKRAPITVDEKNQKERFEAKVIQREIMPMEMSRWNEQLADLHKRAGISLDKQAQIAANQKLYNMALQDREQFEELADSLSLREINRFHYRRNRSDGTVPVKKRENE